MTYFTELERKENTHTKLNLWQGFTNTVLYITKSSPVISEPVNRFA
jgi:hypothetical protein